MSSNADETAKALRSCEKELARLLVELLGWAPKNAKLWAADLIGNLGHSEFFFHEHLSYYLEIPIYTHYGLRRFLDVSGHQRSKIILAVEKYRHATEGGSNPSQIAAIRAKIERILNVRKR